MAVQTSYVKSISSDFPNGQVNSSTLTDEINSSSIVTGLLYISTSEDECYIWFKDVLSSADEATLDGIVLNHLGEDSQGELMTVQITEDSTGTGGNFSTKSVNIPAGSMSTGVEDVYFPYPIKALSVKLTTDDTFANDKIDLLVGPGVVIGSLTQDSGSSPSVWVLQNYTVGDKVLYTTSTYGERVYTCIQDTVSNEVPTNKAHWRHGYELYVSRSVLRNTELGYYIELSDGTSSQSLNRVVFKTTNSIFVEDAPSVDFLASSPTLVKQTVYILKDHFIGNGKFTIGDSKIGGSYIPEDVIVRVKYTNSSSVSKNLYGFVEYIY